MNSRKQLKIVLALSLVEGLSWKDVKDFEPGSWLIRGFEGENMFFTQQQHNTLFLIHSSNQTINHKYKKHF
jgi:hypothetical protein